MIDWRDRARARMKAAGITQERLAQNFGMSPAAIQKWLAGDRQPTFEQINQIAQALNVSQPWLTYGLDSTSRIDGLPDTPRKVLSDLIRLEREGKLRPEHWDAMAALVVAFTHSEGSADGC